MMNADPVALQRQMLMKLMAGQNLAGPTPMGAPQMGQGPPPMGQAPMGQMPPPMPAAPTPGQGAQPYQPPMQPMGGRRGR